MLQKCEKNVKAEDIGILADFLGVISEANRLRILCFLQKNQEQCVCEIWKFLDLPQNLISHHLKVLKDFNLLASRKEGPKVYYSINQKEIDRYKVYFNSILSEGEK